MEGVQPVLFDERDFEYQMCIKQCVPYVFLKLSLILGIQQRGDLSSMFWICVQRPDKSQCTNILRMFSAKLNQIFKLKIFFNYEDIYVATHLYFLNDMCVQHGVCWRWEFSWRGKTLHYWTE